MKLTVAALLAALATSTTCFAQTVSTFPLNDTSVPPGGEDKVGLVYDPSLAVSL